jgi:hypothetical protein
MRNGQPPTKGDQVCLGGDVSGGLKTGQLLYDRRFGACPSGRRNAVPQFGPSALIRINICFT